MDGHHLFESIESVLNSGGKSFPVGIVGEAGDLDLVVRPHCFAFVFLKGIGSRRVEESVPYECSCASGNEDVSHNVP